MAGILRSSPLRIEKGLLRNYAEVTGDWNPLHLDEEFAARTRMGGIIAHGTLSLNLLLRLFADCFGRAALMGTVLDIRFVRPVRLGDLVVGCASSEDRPQRTFDVWVEDEKAMRVMEGTMTFPNAIAPA
jgi:acyl dehydratase